ncbi:MAG: CHAT domain-containing protein, partial [Acidobacteriota bacterium]
GGWVFGKDRILSSREIFRARRVPRLVFANACFSAVVNKGKALTAAELNRQLAGIAEAFFERGVQNYIGSGWPVDDELAVQFATTFYEMALAGVVRSGQPTDGRKKANAKSRKVASPSTLAAAMKAAREAILQEGNTWGAYQHYGKATDKLLVS